MKVVHLDDIEPFFVDGANVNWKPLRAELGVRAFGTNAYAGEPGDTVVERHNEGAGGPQEMYVVVRGRATFTVGGESFDAPAATVVFLDDPAVEREARAEEPGTLVLAVGADVGKAFRVSAWEYAWCGYRARSLGRWDEARAIVEEGLAEQPDSPGLLFGLACVEAHEGDREAALDHLGQAAAKSESVAEWTKDEPSLDPIRDDPRFPR